MEDKGSVIMGGVLLEGFLFVVLEKVFDFLIALKRFKKMKIGLILYIYA